MHSIESIIGMIESDIKRAMLESERNSELYRQQIKQVMDLSVVGGLESAKRLAKDAPLPFIRDTDHAYTLYVGYNKWTGHSWYLMDGDTVKFVFGLREWVTPKQPFNKTMQGLGAYWDAVVPYTELVTAVEAEMRMPIERLLHTSSCLDVVAGFMDKGIQHLSPSTLICTGPEYNQFLYTYSIHSVYTESVETGTYIDTLMHQYRATKTPFHQLTSKPRYLPRGNCKWVAEYVQPGQIVDIEGHSYTMTICRGFAKLIALPDEVQNG